MFIEKYSYRYNTETSAVKQSETTTYKFNKKPKTKKLDSHLKNNSCATMMLSNNLCYFQVNTASYGKKKKTGVLLASTQHTASPA